MSRSAAFDKLLSLAHGIKPAQIALTVGLAASATISGALFIEHALGVMPCELCLKQRIPYYAGAPLAFLAGWAGGRVASPRLSASLLVVVGLVFAVGAVMSAYHGGVEWGLWRGPADCTGPIDKPVAIVDFLKQLRTVKVVRCDEVAMRIFGLSLAAWNMMIATALSAAAFAGAALAFRRH